MTKLTRRQSWEALSLWGDPRLAGAVRPSPRRTNRAPEHGIQNAILQALRLHPRVAWVQRMNSGAYKTEDGRYVRFGFRGCPDVWGQLKDGRLLCIEVKSERGRATEEQAAFLDVVSRNGGVAGLARSIDEALAIVEGRG